MEGFDLEQGFDPVRTKYKGLPNKRFGIIYADPPWDYNGQTQHGGKGVSNTGAALSYYDTVTTDYLRGLPVRDISEEDCLLFMWATSPHLDQAIDLGKAWGFKWATVGFIWNKCKPNPGFYTMSDSELCLIFKRGKIPQPRGIRNARQSLFQELIELKRTRHSAKPTEIRERIELMFPEQSKIELFAREKAIGWECWGNQL